MTESTLKEAVSKIISEMEMGKGRKLFSNILISDANDPWRLRIRLDYREMQNISIQPIHDLELNHIIDFRDQLSETSQDLFCPYPWTHDEKLREQFYQSVQNSQNQTDASYWIIHNDKPIGHFFLWRVKKNPSSQKYGICVSELGIAISDAYHGKGLGTFAVRFLQEIAKLIDNDGVELTTAFHNNAGWQAYVNTGFEPVGEIQTPLEVNVTESDALTRTKKFRLERQMVFVINESQRTNIMRYL